MKLDEYEIAYISANSACDVPLSLLETVPSPFISAIDPDEYEELKACHDVAVEAHDAAREYTERVRASMLREIRKYIAQRDDLEDKAYGLSCDRHFYRKAYDDALASEMEARERIAELEERSAELEKAVKFWRRAWQTNAIEALCSLLKFLMCCGVACGAVAAVVAVAYLTGGSA